MTQVPGYRASGWCPGTACCGRARSGRGFSDREVDGDLVVVADCRDDLAKERVAAPTSMWPLRPMVALCTAASSPQVAGGAAAGGARRGVVMWAL
jgi:hypothetical protein